jgi:pimeloyl-ACP methyl ester carboxylesterase
LLLNGSGPLDRDSNIPGQALNVANVLATALASHRVASLRFDKRGVGKSGGDYLTASFERETNDALAALDALRRSPRIDPEHVILVGHSVGATIAIRMGSRDRGLAGIVLLSASCLSGGEVMRQQSERIAESLRRRTGLLSGWLVRRQARVRRRLFSSTGEVVRIGWTRLPARWFCEFMAYDPAPDLAAIACPVLAITGAKDLQVDPGDVGRMGELVAAPFEGHTPADLTHFLRTDAGPPSIKTYPEQLRRPVDADLVEQVAAWTAACARYSPGLPP